MALLEAIIEIGSTCDFSAIAIERVLGVTGIARSTFYEHFRTKDESLRAALRLVAGRLLAALRSASQGHREPKWTAIEVLLDFATDQPAPATFLFARSLSGDSRAVRIRQELLKQVQEVIEETEAERSGRRSDQVPAAMLVAGITRLLTIRLATDPGDLSDGLADGLHAWINAYVADEAVAGDYARLVQLNFSSPPLRPQASGPISVPLYACERKSVADADKGRRLRVVAALARCSYEHGFGRVKVADITAAAGVSRRTFYGLFVDKSHAAVEANHEYFLAAMTVVASEFFEAKGWPERVWAAANALFGFLVRHPERSHLAFVETHVIGEDAVKLTYDRLNAFTLFLEEGYSYRPGLSQPPRACSEILKATMFEVAFQHLLARSTAGDLDQVLPLMTYTVLAPFMGTVEAREFVIAKASEGRP